jgi:hypothetical protein
MKAVETCKALAFLCLAAVLIYGSSLAAADEKKPPAPKAAAAKPAAAPAAHAAPAGGAAPHGPAAPAAGHGPTTTTAGHGPTTTTTGGAATARPGGANTTARPGTAPTAAGSHPGVAASSPHSAAGRPPNGSNVVSGKNGNEVRMRADGRPGDVHVANRNMEIHHGLSGNRRVEVTRGDRRIVAERGGRGYVESRYRYGGREYGHRSYYYNGRAYDHFYHGYYYRGGYVEMYTPAYYYAPAFYGWAYNPWLSPVPYAWGFAGNPWYGYYGGYFAPYPVYPSASYWLTDYLISQTLAASYQARVDAQQQVGANAYAEQGAAPLTPEVKGLIAAEVQRQIAISNAEAQTAAQNAAPNPALSGIQAMLGDNISHIFVAGRDIDVVDAAGVECALTEGDALQLTGPPPPGASAANLSVLSSKGGKECRKGATVSVAVADLQDMQNHLRETIDQGMGELQTKQGKGGLPALPPSANVAPAKALFAAEAPPPDATAGSQINEQLNEADRAEREVLAETAAQPAGAVITAAPPPPPPAAPASAPVNISLGETIDEVSAALGQPLRVVDLGAKKIYIYKDMKITFNGGKVSDVQ